MPTVRMHEPMSTWEDGDFVQGFALVNRKERRQDKKGRDYLDLELADATTSLPAKVWPDSPALNATFDEKDFVFFKGAVRSFRDQRQLSLDHCRRVTENDRQQGFDEGDYVPTTPEDLEDLHRRLRETYPGGLERDVCRQLAEETLRRYGQALENHAAGKSIHHAYRGGLLEHIVAMAEVARSVCGHYAEIDRDLVLLGVLFHDLGKLVELAAMPENDYTLEGQLVGHVAIGYRMVGECCDAVEVFPDDLRLHLEHLILSHQGRLEYGSPVEPSTPEAFVLSIIDELDSKLNQLRNLRRQNGAGMHYVRGLGRSIYLDPSIDSIEE